MNLCPCRRNLCVALVLKTGEQRRPNIATGEHKAGIPVSKMFFPALKYMVTVPGNSAIVMANLEKTLHSSFYRDIKSQRLRMNQTKK